MIFFYYNKKSISYIYIFKKVMSTSNPPQFTISKWNGVALWSWQMDQDTCAICKSSLVDKCVHCQVNETSQDECKTAFGECSHVFHEHCINQWIKEHKTCPICALEWKLRNTN